MGPAANRFFGIVELVAHLIQFLDNNGISRLMQTNRHLNALCSPALYCNVKSAFKLRKPHNVFSSAESAKALARNVHLVRQLCLEPPEIVYYANCIMAFQDELLHQPTDTPTEDIPQQPSSQLQQQQQRPLWLAPLDPYTCAVLAIPPMTLLTKLRFRVDYSKSYRYCPYLLPSFRDPKATLTYVCWIMTFNSHLQDLTLDSLIIKDQRDVRLLTTSIFRLKSLQRLSIVLCQKVYWEKPCDLASTIFFCCPPSLQSFEIRLVEVTIQWYREMSGEYLAKEPGQLQLWETDDAECGLPTTTPRRQEPLMHLTRMDHSDVADEGVSESDVRSMLAHCPNLTSISIPNLTDVKNIHCLARDIAQFCPKLSSLDHENYGDVTRGLVLHILEALPPQQVKMVICTSYDTFKVLGLDNAGWLFRQHSRTLQSIVFSGCQNIDTKTIQVVLVECEALEQLLVDWETDKTRHELCIDLEKAVEFPWVCTRIQELGLTIAIPDEPLHRRADDGVPYYERPAPTALSTAEKEQFKSLEALYRQLGELKELRALDLRAIFFDPQDRRPVSENYEANTFPGMLSLGCKETGRIGYLSHLSGLTKLKKFLGSTSVMTRETKVTFGEEEAIWMARHWSALEKV
ncbi:hypothetical protein BGZ95_007671 [Linnemannia exigua]|uniref:Uncharacterized protein n=1 Tax=Linnemannia exigua TaxID=604196 RepID=A0AAD4DFD7_9FUNG|nr:hypothetical protein BGZ95_007671 [Linnemannia exigua]